MKRIDEIRRLLRGADPAGSRELSTVERARVRAAITSAALRGRTRRSYVPLLAAGAAITAAAAVCLALVFRGEHRALVMAPPPNVTAPAIPAPAPAPAVAAPAVDTASRPVAAKRPTRAASAHEHPRVAHPGVEGGTTRIVFTGPEGTKIVWFVGTPTQRS